MLERPDAAGGRADPRRRPRSACCRSPTARSRRSPAARRPSRPTAARSSSSTGPPTRRSLMTVATADPAAAPTVVRKGPERLDFPALSPGGTRVAFQMMSREDWEIVVVNRDGTGETRVTRDIQHDVLPQFLTETRLARRHRRTAASPVVSLRSANRHRARASFTTTRSARSRRSTRGTSAPTAARSCSSPSATATRSRPSAACT